ncbi:M14 family zinc carboxypeptidase [Maricaulis sp.]|uniref:M14 family zinc carboxypeptidase n=1 Tax=Maricaulis sp. TaxID=1486257 RepID=UPI002635C639|nr:M14 family zinc carboxypeptidase [Maricaulis sp.]
MLNWKAAAAGVTSLFLVLNTAPDTHAEPIDFYQVDGVEYDASIPAPEDRLGFGVGEHPIRHDQLVSYMTEIANGSDRISVETIGYSHQRRPILFFTITSPENHARIDEIRESHLAQLDPSQPAGDGPAVIWINYGVHGAESSGMDAAIPALYHFAAAQGAEIEQTLDDAVILMTAVFNPDGHSRRVNHVEMFAGSARVTNPAHEQHNLWTQARVNHYWFDLNRQWLLQTQPESQAWLTQWHRWKPQVSADFHEMGTESTYYFHPGEPLRRNPLIPERARDLTIGIAQRHIEFLDSEGRLYTSEEGFDNFYVGKGSTYPQVNGSLGILFEIGAARGGLIEAERGLVSHSDNVRTQFRTTLTTVQGALDQRDEIAAYQRQFFADALAAASADNTSGYVIAADGDPVRLNYFLDLLERHDIRFYEAARDIRAGGRNFAPGEAFIVPLEQPQYTMIRSMFDRPTEFAENVFYDVSGWTMPLAYDLDYAELSNIPRGMMGEEAQSQPLAQPAPPVSSYGYIVRWSDYYAPRALYRLLDADVRVRVATQAVTIHTHQGLMDFTPGTVFIPFMGQEISREAIHEMVSDIAAEDGVPVFSALSGSTPGNTPDLGDGAGFRSVDRPEVLVLFDDGLSLNDAGEVWHQLDHRMHIPVTLRRKDQIGSLDWSRYTHLVIVGGGRTSLGDAQERVEQWVREEGGIVIATRQAARTMQNAFFGDDEAEANSSDENDAPVERRDYSSMRINDAEHVIGGTIFAGDLDTSHPIGFGYMDRFIPLHRNTTIVLDRPDNDPFAVVVEYTEEPLLSGYASQRRLDEIAGTPAVVARRAGAGSVILFVDNPNFRATFRGTEKMFLNAIFFGGLMDRPRGDY